MTLQILQYVACVRLRLSVISGRTYLLFLVLRSKIFFIHGSDWDVGVLDELGCGS